MLECDRLASIMRGAGSLRLLRMEKNQEYDSVRAGCADKESEPTKKRKIRRIKMT